jgi:LmbE family N-acetylglucosaminyl deacetylase
MHQSIKKRLDALRPALLSALQYFFFICARNIDAVTASGPLLVVAPHPDDETLGCGAIIARARTAGQKVRVVVVTDGSGSTRSNVITPEELTRIRHREARTAGKVLGLGPEDIAFLDFPDGKAHRHIDAIATALSKHIRDFNPRHIFCSYDRDGHPDHRAVAEAIDRLWRGRAIACRVFEYPIWFWPYGALRHLYAPLRLIRLRRVSARRFLGHKKAAMAEYRSQCENLTGEDTWFTFTPRFLARFFRDFELFFEKVR